MITKAQNYRHMKNDIKNYVFLLGGHDLEMKEIKQLLDQHKVAYLDEKLSWTDAKWSAYSKYFESPKYKNKTFVGIELFGKEDIPKGAEDIDHHNFDSDKKPAIEQVAEQLGVELNRWQKLVAANDKAYISGMEEICATKKEIEEIRKKDKREQGVTEKDEAKAKESVKKHKIEDRDIIIVKSLTNKFSPITDLMYGKTNKLIIYNDKVLTYYGAITKKLRETYNNEIKSGKIYYGGRKTAGYLGFAEGSWTEEEIIEQKDKLINFVKTQNPQKLYSHHIFLFPFKWKIWDTKEDDSLEKKFAVKKFSDYLKNNDWKPNSFELEYYSHYNEYNYFYEHVRNILYDLGDDLKTKTTENNDKLVNPT
jgi:hypothetical protein